MDFSDNCIMLNGDCLELMRDIPDHAIDMIFTDLPYGTTKNDWDSLIDFDELWKQYERVIKDNGCIALWAQSPFDKLLACSNMKLYRYEWIVEKTHSTGFLNAKKMPMKAHENVLVFYKKLPTYNPQKTFGHERKVATAAHKQNCKEFTGYGKYDVAATSYDSTERYPRDVVKFKWDRQKSALHPTQKPIAACEYFIKTYTNPGDVVLDSCMGSGSAGVAALNLGRKFIGMEMDEQMYRVACARLVHEGCMSECTSLGGGQDVSVGRTES